MYWLNLICKGQETSKSEGTQAGGTVSAGKMTTGTCTPRLAKDNPSLQHKASGGSDYPDGTDMVREAELRQANNNNNINNMNNNNRSRTTNNNNNKMGKEDLRSGTNLSGWKSFYCQHWTSKPLHMWDTLYNFTLIRNNKMSKVSWR